MRRADAGVLNKRQMESLINAGAFDQMDKNRAKLSDAVKERRELETKVEEVPFWPVVLNVTTAQLLSEKSTLDRNLKLSKV